MPDEIRDVKTLFIAEAAFLAGSKKRQRGFDPATGRLLQHNDVDDTLIAAWSKDSLQVLKAGAQEIAGIKDFLAGLSSTDITLKGSSSIVRDVNNSAIFMSGGTDFNNGASIRLTGGAAAGENSVINLYADGAYLLQADVNGIYINKHLTLENAVNIIGSSTSIINLDSKFTASGITGAVVAASINIGSSVVITGFLDEDNMVSNSNVKGATQQSIKAYADSLVGTEDEFTATLTGCTTSHTATFKYRLSGNYVTLFMDALTGVSNTNA